MSATDDYQVRLCFDADVPADVAWSVTISDAVGTALVHSLGCGSSDEAMEAARAWIADRRGA